MKTFNLSMTAFCAVGAFIYLFMFLDDPYQFEDQSEMHSVMFTCLLIGIPMFTALVWLYDLKEKNSELERENYNLRKGNRFRG